MTDATRAPGADPRYEWRKPVGARGLRRAAAEAIGLTAEWAGVKQVVADPVLANVVYVVCTRAAWIEIQTAAARVNAAMPPTEDSDRMVGPARPGLRTNAQPETGASLHREDATMNYSGQHTQDHAALKQIDAAPTVDEREKALEQRDERAKAEGTAAQRIVLEMTKPDTLNKWLTAADVAAIANCGDRNASKQLNRLAEHKVIEKHTSEKGTVQFRATVNSASRAKKLVGEILTGAVPVVEKPKKEKAEARALPDGMQPATPKEKAAPKVTFPPLKSKARATGTTLERFDTLHEGFAETGLPTAEGKRYVIVCRSHPTSGKEGTLPVTFANSKDELRQALTDPATWCAGCKAGVAPVDTAPGWQEVKPPVVVETSEPSAEPSGEASGESSAEAQASAAPTSDAEVPVPVTTDMAEAVQEQDTSVEPNTFD